MKLGLIAGNRSLPLLFSKTAKNNNKDLEIIAVCFKGETHPSLVRLVDKAYWVKVGQLDRAVKFFQREGVKKCVMVGQITPRRIFNHSGWDKKLIDLLETTDYRPHSVFLTLINYLQEQGLCFLDSTIYMQEFLAQEGVMNHVPLGTAIKEDVLFGLDLITRFVELDVGQTIVVKDKAAIALEAMEGTDNTIRRGFRIAGKGCTVLKFSRRDQDLRFDVPVVGLKTLSLLERGRAQALILEAQRVFILEKDRFLRSADQWGITVVGKKRE